MCVCVCVLLRSCLNCAVRQQRRIAGGGPPAPATPLRPLPGLLLAALLWLPIVFGFLLPVLQLALWSLPRWRGLLAPDFLALLGTSLLIAASTALAATALGLLLIWARRLRADRPRRAAARLARRVGYATAGSRMVPGSRPSQVELASLSAVTPTAAPRRVLFDDLRVWARAGRRSTFRNRAAERVMCRRRVVCPGGMGLGALRPCTWR